MSESFAENCGNGYSGQVPLRAEPDSDIVRLRVASGFFGRALGLMFRRRLPRGEALLIDHCRAIHTCFMRFAIDAMFVDRQGNPVKLVRDIPPWRLLVFGGKNAYAVVEASAGWLQQRHISLPHVVES